MRYTALFDGPGRQPGVLWPAGGSARPPRRAAPDKAGLVPLGAALVDGHHRCRALRAPTIASNKIVPHTRGSMMIGGLVIRATTSAIGAAANQGNNKSSMAAPE